MNRKSVWIKVATLLVLFLAFYIGGMVGLACENFHDSLALSTGIFTAVFTGIIAIAAKIYHLFYF